MSVTAKREQPRLKKFRVQVRQELLAWVDVEAFTSERAAEAAVYSAENHGANWRAQPAQAVQVVDAD